MWKKRDNNQILDIYKNKHATTDDCLISKKKTELYSNVQMSKSQPSILYSYDKQKQTKIYPGNEFDIFGKKQEGEHFAPLYSIEQFTPSKPNRKERYLKGEKLKRTEEFKRTVQVDPAMTSMLKKRKIVVESSHIDIFNRAVASTDTPAVSMFVEKEDTPKEDEDLAYY